MRKIVIYTLLVVFFNNVSGFSQEVVIKCYEKYYKELPLLTIADTNLIPILDSAVSFEKNCERYNESWVFTLKIWLTKKDTFDLYRLEISSSDDIDEALNDPLTYSGFFFYQNHLFLVYGQDVKKFFSFSKIIVKFRYCSMNRLPIFDDAHSSRVYYYIGNRFLFDRGSSYLCK
jgi:hypothetical protein